MPDPISATNEDVFVVAETSYANVEKPAGADALLVIRSDIQVSRERRKRRDKTNTRSVRGFNLGRPEGTWEIEKYLLGSGVAGTEPDDGILWERCMGSKAIVGGTSVTYSLAKVVRDKTFNVHRHVDDFSEIGVGAFGDSLAINLSGVEEQMVVFSGPCADKIVTGYDTIKTTTSSNVTQPVNVAKQFQIGGIVQIGSNDNGGVGFEVVDRDLAADTITLDTALATTIGDVIIPFRPVATVQDVPAVYGDNGSFAISGGPTFDIRASAVRVGNNHNLRNDSFGQAKAVGLTNSDDRLVEVDFSFWFDRSLTRFFTDANQLIAQDITIVSGSVAGNICTINIPELVIDPPSDTWPERGDIEVSVTGQAQDSSAAEGEVTVAFT